MHLPCTGLLELAADHDGFVGQMKPLMYSQAHRLVGLADVVAGPVVTEGVARWSSPLNMTNLSGRRPR